MSENNNSVFSDFCQAWVERFPNSELPAAWEEDVRGNLKSHKTKVLILREELEKEEMYVDYLQKLLVDIERKKSNAGQHKAKEDNNSLLEDDEVSDSHILHDLKAKSDPFVTVINVSSATTADELSMSEKSASLPSRAAKQGPQPPKRTGRLDLSKSKESLRSISSPTTPTSPLISSSTEDFMGQREGLGVPGSSISSSSASSKEPLPDLDEDIDLLRRPSRDRGDTKFRGQPDGRDQETVPSVASLIEEPLRASASVRQLMVNWEGRPPITNKPAAVSRRSKLPLPNDGAPSSQPQPLAASRSATGRKDSDSSSRGRMGSPSGKSHDSSDSEHSWSRQDSGPHSKRRASGETRLDRLVRRPSGEKKQPNMSPVTKPKIKPRNLEPLYDTVAADEELDEVYDNHLLYETKKSDTIGSGGSTDLGFDEPSSSTTATASATKGGRTGTLSSSDTSLSHRRFLGETDQDDDDGDQEEEETYVNLQYFMQQRRNTGDSLPDSPLPAINNLSLYQSDDELEMDDPKPRPKQRRQIHDELPATPKDEQSAGELEDHRSKENIVMYKCILASILDSEAIYLEALSVMLQYMKAMKVTLSTDQPFIPKEDFEIIFYKVPDLHELHLTFHGSLKKLVERWDGNQNVGHTFKMLASQNKVYVAYLNNYQRALEALHRCSDAYPQFADLTRSIKLRSVKGQRQGQSLSLEDLLHKPVARIQKQCLSVQDLIKHTPFEHPDHIALTEALTTFQELVNDYNTSHAGELFPHQERPQRHLVKNSFIVELSEGQRKLRHLFLFNDVLVCAKYKASGGGNHPAGSVAVGRNQEKFTFQLKWYIPLEHVSDHKTA